MLWKLRLYWNGRSISDIEHYDFTRSLNPVLAWPFVQWWTLMPLALVGTVLSLRTRGPATIVALFNLAWCASVVLFFVVDRYRLPSLSGLAVAASLAISQIPKVWAVGSWARRVALVSLVTVAAAVAWPVGVVDNFGEMWLRLGADYERSGRLDEARDAYRHALEIAPTDSRARLSLERVSAREKH
jgi:tetratricopeptide (TPR) repeat protein